MGLRREVMEELEEEEKKNQSKNDDTLKKYIEDNDLEMHGLGHIMQHRKFIGD